MGMTEPQGRYSAYLLRLWQTAGAGEVVCRASIEDAHSNERVGFGSLDGLFDYLRARAGGGRGTVREANGGAGGQAAGKEVSCPRESTSPSEGSGCPNDVQAVQSSKGEENEEE